MNYIEEIDGIVELVGEVLADESEITPAEIRQCFSAMTAFLRKISPLASGTYNIGDVESADVLRTVSLPYDVGTSDYRVVGSLVSKKSNFSHDNDVFEMVKDKATNSFKLCLREVTGHTQDLDFEWAIYAKNT